jgi:hypothetical protein
MLSIAFAAIAQELADIFGNAEGTMQDLLRGPGRKDEQEDEQEVRSPLHPSTMS